MFFKCLFFIRPTKTVTTTRGRSRAITMLFLLLFAGATYSSYAVAQVASPTATPDPDLQTRTVEFEGNLRVDNDLNPDASGNLHYNLHTQRFELQASVRLPRLMPESVAQQILFVVRSRMEQDVIINGILQVNHLTAADYLKEAYLEFKRVGGLPVAVIVGVSEVSYGQDYPGTLDFQNDAAHAMTDPDRGQVKGFTVALDQRIGPLIDQVEANFFYVKPKSTFYGAFGRFCI
jgi:hypothetical protein